MKFIYLIVFTVVSIFLGATGHIAERDMYIGMTIFLAIEYLECAIERKK